MVCENLKLAEFLRGELEPPESQAVLSHVENCQVCRERIRVMAILEARFQQETPSKQSRTRRYLMAAAAVFILGLALLTYYSVWSPVSTVEKEQLANPDFGAVWIATSKGITVLDRKGFFTRLTPGNSPLPGRNINSIIIDQGKTEVKYNKTLRAFIKSYKSKNSIFIPNIITHMRNIWINRSTMYI